MIIATTVWPYTHYSKGTASGLMTRNIINSNNGCNTLDVHAVTD